MKVDLSPEEVRRAIARAAVEKANEKGFPYRWGAQVDAFGLSGEGGVVVELRDGDAQYVVLSRKTLPVESCPRCGAPPGYHYQRGCVERP